MLCLCTGSSFLICEEMACVFCTALVTARVCSETNAWKRNKLEINCSYYPNSGSIWKNKCFSFQLLCAFSSLQESKTTVWPAVGGMALLLRLLPWSVNILKDPRYPSISIGKSGFSYAQVWIWIPRVKCEAVRMEKHVLFQGEGKLRVPELPWSSACQGSGGLKVLIVSCRASKAALAGGRRNYCHSERLSGQR